MAIKVSGCYVYPLKSGRGNSLNKLELTQRGPKDDRSWMLVRAEGLEAGKFITQRDKDCEKLAVVYARPKGKWNIEFSIPNGQKICVSHDDLSDFDGFVDVWGDQCIAMDAGNKAARWFSSYLRRPCRLVRIPDDNIRSPDPAYSRKGDQVSFADGFPLLITNAASLEKLKKHFPSETDIEMERFRPNIVFEGADPFEEDSLHEIRIGNVVLELVKPCSRCKITTVDQDRGISPTDEPLKTLGLLRRGKGKGLQGVFFGQNAIPRALGTIEVGNDVEILSKRPLHPALEITKVN